jgi:hypothetical protein
MPTKTTRIRRGILVGKKDRLVIDQWSCDVCRAEFGDYHDAVRHEDSCRVAQSRPKAGHQKGIETFGTQLMETASDGLLSISSTTNVNNNHSVRGDNRESRDPTDAIIPLVIHVARPQTSIQETRDEGNTMADASTVRRDLRRQMAANRNLVNEHFHLHRPLLRKAAPSNASAEFEVDADEAPSPIRTRQVASAQQHQIASISNMHHRLLPHNMAEPMQQLDGDEVIGIQRRPPPPPEASMNSFPITRTDYGHSINGYPPERESYPPVRTKRQEGLAVQHSHRDGVDGATGGIAGIDAHHVERHHRQEAPTIQRVGNQQPRQRNDQDREWQATSSQMKWVCDCCREAQFGSYVDAFRHEMQCRKQMFLLAHRQQQTELETLVHSEPEKELRLSANRRAWRREQIKRHVYEKSRSLSSTAGDRNLTTMSSISESYVGAMSALASGKSSSSSGVTKWLCSVCKEVCFDHYLDACRHEKECARLRRGQQQHHHHLLQQVDE